VTPILRIVFMYVFLLVLFRIAGKRTLAEMTSFDFVLLLVISEATQQAMIDDDHSMTNAVIIITAFVGLNIVMSGLTYRFKKMDKVVSGQPIVIVEHGKLIRERLAKERITEEEILAFAREHHGLERMDQIKFAVLEAGGDISIIPAKRADKG
jgi:uncharacterized membrane protein YcaP (DUF421 family)